MKIVVIGAVKSTKWILEKLIAHDFKVMGVLGYESTNITNVSGWVDLKATAEFHNLPYLGFNKINDDVNLNWVKSLKPDCIFAVGFSQLLSEQWFNIPSFGCIGFHPTKLPQGRGRAPLAWIVHDLIEGAATFFLMGPSADDGPIFVQVPFSVAKDDDATSVEKKIEISINSALDVWLPELKNGIWNPLPQNEKEAFYYGKRAPEDGLIDWRESSYQIDRLIKASTHPHSGAYSYFKSRKIIIWSSELENRLKIKGVIGRILLIEKSKGYLIQTGNGLLWLKLIEFEKEIRVGDKLGFNVEDEIYKIKLLLTSAKQS